MPSPTSDASRGGRRAPRRAVAWSAAWVVAAWLAAPAAVALGQFGDVPGGYPAPTAGFPIGQPADPSGFGVPGLPTPDPFGVAPPPGFAGVPNPLFAADNTLMYFADGKKAIVDLITALKEA